MAKIREDPKQNKPKITVNKKPAEKKEKKPVGRPRAHTQTEDEKIIANMIKYTNENTIPILAEFCYLNNVTKQYLHQHEEFTTVLKRLLAKKEAQLEKGALGGKINSSVAIFSLKQLGWSDKQEIEHSGNMGVTIVDDLK
jgi:hypothetical protein